VKARFGIGPEDFLEQLEEMFHAHQQSRFVLIAFDDLKTALPVNDHARVWYSVQGLLIAAANLSKLFYSGGPRKARCAKLRAKLGLAADSPIAGRDVRNSFEHFDQRIAAWAASPDRKKSTDLLVGPRSADWDIRRHFDSEKFIVTFGKDHFKILPAVEEARHILGAAENALDPWLKFERKSR
jgi:hypothetical protein